MNLIEIGSYHGNGSTLIICKAIKDFVPGAKLKSIECNESRLKIAQEYIMQQGLSECVDFVYGFSLGRDDLPTLKELLEWLGNVDKNLFIDDATGFGYAADQAHPDAPDDKLLDVMIEFQFRPHFVLLDSAGHLGLKEFKWLMRLVRGPFIIALDDCKTHIKHKASVDIIKSDMRFQKMFESYERFGFCIYGFKPEGWD